MNVLSQGISGVWHGNAKSPDNKEVLFVFLFVKNQDGSVSKMAIPTFDVMDIKPKATVNQNAIRNALIKENNKNYKIVEIVLNSRVVSIFKFLVI